MTKTIAIMQKYSLPLIFGVFIALAFANLNSSLYHELLHTPLFRLHEIFTDSVVAEQPHWEHYFSLHFLINDIFMVFFFAVAGKEICDAVRKGGPLNPIKNAINPLLGTAGGILGPVFIYFIANKIMGNNLWEKGWGIPTATDIALAWLVARFIFGAKHPAISFLLLLAIADDAIGLVIIAFVYPSPHNPVEWANALWLLPACLSALALNRFKIRSWIPYIFLSGSLAWYALYSAHLHPALALVFIVPFLPYDCKENEKESPLNNFEHTLSKPIDFGLFFFAFVNAGVEFGNITNLSWIVLSALFLGKAIGISLFSTIGHKCGASLPESMRLRHLLVVSLISGIGLTVALFVSAQAFVDVNVQGAAKMGALFSVFVAIPAFLTAWIFRIEKEHDSDDDGELIPVTIDETNISPEPKPA